MAKRLAPRVLPPVFRCCGVEQPCFFGNTKNNHEVLRVAMWHQGQQGLKSSRCGQWVELMQRGSRHFQCCRHFFPLFAYLQVECEHFGWWKRWVCHVRKRWFPLTYVVEWTRLKHHSTIFHPFTIKAVFFEWTYMDIWKYILNDHRTHY